MIPRSAKRILIAPLDWGLGHTTRCVPIIRRLLQWKCEVIFAGNDEQQTFIKSLFDNLTCRNLPGYNVRYSRGALMPALLAQLPRLAATIRQEHKWLRSIVQEERIDGIISDNRYGLWHPRVPCVILTHQVEIKTGLGQHADDLIRNLHYRYLNRFSACWIVDRSGDDNLGSSLSHPGRRLPGSRYIGWLSQFHPVPHPGKGRHLLILLSGPEPQRTMLSDLLWSQVSDLRTPIAFVEGSSSASRSAIPGHIAYYPRLGGVGLQRILEDASLVVCRSGYSTLMDLVLLKKRAILIPTPGQTEQEYLARTLMDRQIFYSAPQKSFSLTDALEASTNFPYRLPEGEGTHEEFMVALDQWLENLGHLDPVWITAS